MDAFAFPFIDQSRDEINARFVGHDPTFLQTASATQAVRTELRGRLHFVVEAHISLSQPFHVVYVHAHHVPQTVREEHGVRSVAYGFFRVAFHQAEFFQALGHEAGYAHVHVPPFYTGACDVQYVVMASFHDAVNVPLAGGKPAVDGSGARIVRAIVLIGFRSCVAKHQPSVFQRTWRRVSVHDFPVHGKNGGETGHAPFGRCDTADGARDVLFAHSGSAKAHGRRVHLMTDGTGPFDFLYFGRCFHSPLVDDRHDEFQRCFLALP